MSRLHLRSAGKRHGRQWIFRGLDWEVSEGDKVAVCGHNGAGKSTFLLCISGYQSVNEGEIIQSQGGRQLEKNDWHSHLSLAAPYLDLPEEYTLDELIHFVHNFKPFGPGFSLDKIPQQLALEQFRNKPLKHFSSGMKQRVKLGCAILSDAKLLLLDEPLSNLDSAGVEWYKDMINSHTADKTVIVCSNHYQEEIAFCNRRFDLKSS